MADTTALEMGRSVQLALTAFSKQTIQESACRWRFRTTASGPLRARASLDGSWLVVGMPLVGKNGRAMRVKEILALLQQNTLLPAGVKYTLDTDAKTICIQAEVPLLDHSDPHREVSLACTGLKLAEKMLQAPTRGTRPDPFGAPSIKGPAPAGQTPAEQTLAGPDLTRLCKAADWPFTAQGADQVRVTLEVVDAFFQASVAAMPNGTIRASVDWRLNDLPSPTRMGAAGLLLLKTTKAVKMVRAAADPTDSPGACMRLETLLEGPVCAALLDRALSALSVACSLCGREMKVIKDERFSRTYLAAVRGRSPKSGR
jgi:hypothetical protein